MQQETKDLKLQIRQVGDKDLKNIVKGLTGVERKVGKISSTLGGLRNIFFGVFGGLGIRELAGAADSVQLLGDRIKVFTGSSEEAEKALNTLFDAANATNTSVDSLAETFNRIAIATKELGLSTEELIGFTATLQNTFRLSGASTAEASAAAIQLSQGLASGQLRGQELRSVLEANAIIGGILAKQLGTTRGQLIKFAESGKITSAVVLNALAKNARQVNQDAQKLGQTFGQTLTKAFNDLKQVINDFNKRFEINKRFADGIELIKNRVTELTIAVGVVLIPTIIKGLTALKAAIATNPIGLLLTGVATLIFFFKDIVYWTQRASLAYKKFINEALASTNDFLSKLASKGGIFRTIIGDPKFFSDLSKGQRDEIKKIESTVSSLTKEYEKSNKPAQDVFKAFENLNQINLPKTINNSKDAIKTLNAQLASGVINLKEYNEQLLVIRETDLKKRFDEGAISALEYRDQLVKIKDINDTFTEKVFTSLNLAAASYSEKIGSITSQLQKGFEASFNKLEDVIFESLQQGKFLFKDFAQFVLNELTRIAIRSQIIAPLSQAIGVGSSSFFASPGQVQEAQASVAGFAKGGAFSQGRQVQFATGGILNSPTFFPLNRGMGLAGEAGPEAVVPLTRTSGGDLGIKANPANVTVNVNNNAGVDVDVQSNQIGNTNVLDITITKAVTSAINSGKLDRTMKSNYGISRQGSR